MPKRLAEVEDFMGKERLASFATVGRNNEPHVVPVFFTYKDEKVYIQTDRSSAKIRNLTENDNVAIAVYNLPFGEEAVIIRGKGRIIESDEEFTKRTQDHIKKYHLKLDKLGRDSSGIPLFDGKTRCIIEVTPKRVIFW
jgi:nitroimidazol reductase NimA-like FMN-containing flavoprotein (pyridoxamine 5'-phosphate oxidase superfamily)